MTHYGKVAKVIKDVLGEKEEEEILEFDPMDEEGGEK